MATCVTAEMATGDNEEAEMLLNIMCNITRDCMVSVTGTFYVWALLTTIFRLVKLRISNG